MAPAAPSACDPARMHLMICIGHGIAPRAADIGAEIFLQVVRDDGNAPKNDAVRRVAARSSGPARGASYGSLEITVARQSAFVCKAEPRGRRPCSMIKLRIIGLSQIDDALIVTEVVVD